MENDWGHKTSIDYWVALSGLEGFREDCEVHCCVLYDIIVTVFYIILYIITKNGKEY